MNKFLSLFFYCVSPFSLAFVHFLRKFIPLRLCIIPAHRLGHLAWEIEIYLSKKNINKSKEKKHFDFFCFTHKISNNCLAQKWKSKIRIIPSYILFPIIRLNRAICKFLNLHNALELKLNVFEGNIYNSNKININFTKKEIDKTEKTLEENGIKKNTKIICLLVRDGEYIKKEFNLDVKSYSHRDSDIDQYIPTVKFLNDKGYFVIRMGTEFTKSMNYKHKRYIELKNSSLNYRLMDIYLAYRCFFSISNGSGWDVLPAAIFKKPVLFLNYMPILGSWTYDKRFMFLYKKYKNKITKKYLTLSEIFEIETKKEYSQENYPNIYFEDNSESELLGSTKEFLELINNNFFKKDKTQDEFKKIFKEYSKKINLREDNSINNSVTLIHSNLNFNISSEMLTDLNHKKLLK